MRIGSLFIFSMIVILFEYPLVMKVVRARQISRFKSLMWIGILLYLIKAFTVAFVVTLFGNQGSPFQLKLLSNSLILMGVGSRLFLIPYLLCFTLVAYFIVLQRKEMISTQVNSMSQASYEESKESELS